MLRRIVYAEVIGMAALTICERLMKQTRDELMDAALRLGLEPLQNRASKADWAAHIEQSLPEFGVNILLQLREAEYTALARYAAEAGEGISISQVNVNEELACALQVLRCYGLAWRDRHAWYLHEEAWQLLRRDDGITEELRFHDLLFDLMQGWLLHVGMMPVEELLDRAARAPEQQPEEYSEVREMCFALLIARCGLGSIFPDDAHGLGWAVHDDVEKPEVLVQRLRSPMIAGLEYPELAPEELIRTQRGMAVPGPHSLYRPLTDWLYDRDSMNDVRYGMAMEYAVYLIQNGAVGAAMEHLYEIVQPRDERDARRGMEAMTQVVNSIPLWDNKGYSAIELAKRLYHSDMPKMPGRNDPCTCGSGKKYKQCCGRRLN